MHLRVDRDNLRTTALTIDCLRLIAELELYDTTFNDLSAFFQQFPEELRKLNDKVFDVLKSSPVLSEGGQTTGAEHRFDSLQGVVDRHGYVRMSSLSAEETEAIFTATALEPMETEFLKYDKLYYDMVTEKLHLTSVDSDDSEVLNFVNRPEYSQY